MNKTKTLGFLVGILAVINIGLLMFLFLGMPKGPGPQGMRDEAKAEKFIQDKFGFDEVQMEQFRKSKTKHMQTARELDTNLESLSRKYYMIDSGEGSDTRDSLLKMINTVSTKIYDNNSTHFDEVKSICNPEQEPEMKSFINGLLNHNKKIRKNEDFEKRK